MFDFLSRNIIAPDSVVEDKKGIKTISTRSRDLLFVTHKKLNRKTREEGITDSFICPITIEISDVSDKDGEAILIHQKDGNVEYRLAKLSEYNTDINVGAYVIGEIPFSRVNRILFNSNDDIDMFNRPSDDYWYPSDKFGILNEEEFTDDFTIVIDEEKALSDCGLNANDILHGIVKREKQRAAILDFVDATRKWVYGKYEFS